MADKSFESLVLILLICKPVTCGIVGPTSLFYFIGDDAHFRWNNTNSSTILSATWGIKKGDIADPQYIHVDILSNKAHFRKDLGPDLMKRLFFFGDLKKGRAWFTLRNVTLNDTNVYLASISDDVRRVLPYPVDLTVTEREEQSEQKDLDITPKEPDTHQVVPSRSPRVVNTITKETQFNPQEDQEDGANINFIKSEIVITAVIFAVLLLVLAILALIFCRCMWLKKMNGRNPASSKRHLLSFKALRNAANTGIKKEPNLDECKIKMTTKKTGEISI